MQLEDLVVVSPDAGRVKLAKKFAEKIGAELAILNKERPAQQVAEIAYVIGDVQGKTAVIVDDMIDTAGTLRAAAETVSDEGAARVFAGATHAVLSGDAYENLASSRVRGDRRHRHDPAAARRARQHPRALVRRPAHRLDPPHLHRRLRRRACSAARTSCSERRARLQDAARPHRRGAADGPRRRPAGGHRRRRSTTGPSCPILLDLLAEAEERAGASVLRRWLRAAGPAGRPLELLLARDFAGFEDALATLAERGFVLRGGG